jgi:hypothetical protein
MATKRRGRRRRKTNRKRRTKVLKGGSFIEAGSLASHIFNTGINTFTIPSPTMVSQDPRITNQFL